VQTRERAACYLQHILRKGSTGSICGCGQARVKQGCGGVAGLVQACTSCCIRTLCTEHRCGFLSPFEAPRHGPALARLGLLQQQQQWLPAPLFCVAGPISPGSDLVHMMVHLFRPVLQSLHTGVYPVCPLATVGHFQVLMQWLHVNGVIADTHRTASSNQRGMTGYDGTKEQVLSCQEGTSAFQRKRRQQAGVNWRSWLADAKQQCSFRSFINSAWRPEFCLPLVC
jgi:hypothetical protein